jgi:hypothetical protein
VVSLAVGIYDDQRKAAAGECTTRRII